MPALGISSRKDKRQKPFRGAERRGVLKKSQQDVGVRLSPVLLAPSLTYHDRCTSRIPFLRS